jgi:hypothetical protein
VSGFGRLGRVAALGALGLGVLLVISLFSDPLSAGAEPQGAEAADDSEESNPLFANAACYVCHIPFVKEELSKEHVEEGITCVKCHGLSAGHANDEDVGATPPDITFKRGEVNEACSECHEEHDVPAKKVVARWIERKPPHKAPVCTDCHGTHKIEREDESESEPSDAE